MPSGGQIRVLIAEHLPLLRIGLREVLESEGSFEVVAAVSDLQAAAESAAALQPDLAFVDAGLLLLEGAAFIALMKDSATAARVILLTEATGHGTVSWALAQGADAVLQKHLDTETIVAAARMAYRSHHFVVTAGLASSAEEGKPAQTDLTPREREVLALLEQGSTDADVAGLLSISVRTVHQHVRHILQKLNAANRREAVRFARDRGLLTPFATLRRARLVP